MSCQYQCQRNMIDDTSKEYLYIKYRNLISFRNKLFNYKYWFIYYRANYIVCAWYLYLISCCWFERADSSNDIVSKKKIVSRKKNATYIYIAYHIIYFYLFVDKIYLIVIKYMNVKWAKKYNTLKRAVLDAVQHVVTYFWKKFALSLWKCWLFLLHSYSRAAWQTFFTPALRDCPRWIIANVSRE